MILAKVTENAKSFNAITCLFVAFEQNKQANIHAMGDQDYGKFMKKIFATYFHPVH